MSFYPSSSSQDFIAQRTAWLNSAIESLLSSGDQTLELYNWARYHMGSLDEQLRVNSPDEALRCGGKRLRGVLTILAAEACGATADESVYGGAAVELIHNFSLVHDDVEDGDEARRHRPTVWKLWGVPHAINTGSNLQALVNRAVLLLQENHGSEVLIDAFEIVTDAIVEMTEGQYLDMEAEQQGEQSLEGYFRMTGGKTAALLAASLELGALLGGAPAETREALREFGRHFGLAFQCRDDYLGIWGDPSVTGKAAGADLLRGKRSLPVVHVLQAASEDGAALARLKSALQHRDVDSVMRLMHAYGTAEAVDEMTSRHTETALACLERASLQGPAATAIGEIADQAVRRRH